MKTNQHLTMKPLCRHSITIPVRRLEKMKNERQAGQRPRPKPPDLILVSSQYPFNTASKSRSMTQAHKDRSSTTKHHPFGITLTARHHHSTSHTTTLKQASSMGKKGNKALTSPLPSLRHLRQSQNPPIPSPPSERASIDSSTKSIIR